MPTTKRVAKARKKQAEDAAGQQQGQHQEEQAGQQQDEEAATAAKTSHRWGVGAAEAAAGTRCLQIATRLFAEADTDQSGYIEVSELQRLVTDMRKRLGEKPGTDEQAAQEAAEVLA